jgi:uncharacterized protein (DUF1330 family)
MRAGRRRRQSVPAYVVVSVDVKDPVRYEDYKGMVPASLAAYGGRFLVRGGAVQVREGQWSPKRLVILEFPSLERALAWYDSPEYAEAKALRQATASAELLIVEGHTG